MSKLSYRGVALPAVAVQRQKHIHPLGKVKMVSDQHHGVRPQQIQDLNLRRESDIPSDPDRKHEPASDEHGYK